MCPFLIIMDRFFRSIIKDNGQKKNTVKLFPYCMATGIKFVINKTYLLTNLEMTFVYSMIQKGNAEMQVKIQ